MKSRLRLHASRLVWMMEKRWRTFANGPKGRYACLSTSPYCKTGGWIEWHLNVILHRIKRSETADCPHCKNGVRETIHHYLLICPSYAGARRILQAKLQRDASSIPFLIGTRIGIPHLLRYVSDTKRFSATFGEVRPDDGFKIEEKKAKEKPRRPRDNGCEY